MSISPLLGLGIATSSAISGYEAGKQQATQQYNAAEDRQQKRADALALKQQRDLQLKQLQRADTRAEATYDSETEQLKLQIDQQKQQLTQQGQKAFRDDTYRALDQYFVDYDVRHINNMIEEAKKNPFAPKTFQDTSRLDDINPKADADRAMLKASGVSQDELDALDGTKDGKIDWDLVSKRYKKVTLTDGSIEVRDILKLATFAGYGKYADAARLEEATKLADLAKKTTDTGSAYKEPTSVTEANRYAEAQTRLKAGTATEADKSFIKMMDARMGGTAQAKQAVASDAFEVFKQKGFMNMSQQELQNNDEARRLVSQIELSEGISEAQQKELLELNSLVELAGTAGNLSDEQTGLWDKYLNQLGAYTDPGAGDEAKASYGAFINQFRHNLFGSALTEGELAAFKTAYGDLGQQTRPVLQGLRAAATQVKSKLNTIANLNNPAVMKFRTGMSLEQAKTVMSTLDKRIKFYALVENGTPPDKAARDLGLATQDDDKAIMQKFNL